MFHNHSVQIIYEYVVLQYSEFIALLPFSEVTQCLISTTDIFTDLSLYDMTLVQEKKQKLTVWTHMV